MNKPKHTPGPWNIDKHNDDYEIRAMMDTGHDACIIRMVTSSGLTKTDRTAYSWKHPAKENAMLVAVAPELLKMLDLAVRELEWADKNCQIKPMAGVSTFKSAVAQIKSVISKATGGAE